MKTDFHPISLILIICSLVVAPALLAQDSGIESSHRSQSDIQRQANQIIAHIDAVIFDYTRNGLEGEELETLKRTRKNLSETSETEMARILELLSAAEQDSRNEEYLLEAFEGQKGILSVLRDAMIEEMPDRSDLHTSILDTMRLARREMADSAPSRRAQSAKTIDKVIAQLDQLIEQANAAAGTPPPEDPAEADESFAERLAIAVSEQERLNRETLAMERNNGRLRGALPRQETIARMASILHEQARASYPEAVRPLFDAGEDIQTALSNLPVAGREGLALMAQEKVLTHLRQALASLEAEPAETDPSLLAEAIAEAQANLEEAREAIEAEDFAEAARELAESIQ